MKTPSAVPIFLFAVSFFAGPALAWHPYDDVQARDNDPSFQSPPVEEPVNVAGFKLLVDRTQLGYAAIPPQAKDGLLGTMNGDEYDVQIRRMPSNVPLDQLAKKMGGGSDPVIKIASAHARRGVKGLRVTCGEKPSFFANHVREISYLYVNPAGETICFSAVARTPHPDWDYFKYLMTEALEPAST